MKNVFFSVLVLFALVSCKKEGCTNSSAINYSADAGKDDGSCQFRSTMVVWFNAATATNAVNQGVSGIELFVEGKSHGSTTMVNSSVTEPACNTEEGIRTEIETNDQNKTVNYQIKKTGTNQILKSGSIPLSGCQKVEFTY